jgi:hypothetical protein
VRERGRRLLAALAAFLRGFAGLEPLAPDPAGARRDLERRAASRRSCC